MQQVNNEQNFFFSQEDRNSLVDGDHDDNLLLEDQDFMPRRMNVSASKTGGEVVMEGLNPNHVEPEQYQGRDARNEFEKNMRQFEEKKTDRTYRFSEQISTGEFIRIKNDLDLVPQRADAKKGEDAPLDDMGAEKELLGNQIYWV